MPRKKGLEYFSIDTDIEINDKITLIEAKHGAVGFAVIIKLLIKIYGDNGYYYDWNERTKLIFSRRINLDYEKVDEIVKDAVEFKFFNKEKFEKYKILTSKRIQQHFIHSTKRRKIVELKKPFLVLNNQNEYILQENVYIIEENANKKSYKIREDKIREDKIGFLDFVYMTKEEHKKLLDKLGKDKTEDMIERLNNYIGSKGKKYKSHYFTILTWSREKIEEKPVKKPKYFKTEDDKKFKPMPPKFKEKIDKMRRSKILDG